MQAATKGLPMAGPGPLQQDLLNVQIFGAYMDAGRTIYDVEPALAKTLTITDANTIPCGEIPLPAQSLYLHFGDESTLHEDDGTAIEGAFVDNIEGNLSVSIVRRGFGSEDFMYLRNGEPMDGVTISLQNPQLPLEAALSQAIRTTVEANSAMLAQIATIQQQLEAQYGQAIRIPSPVEDLSSKEPLFLRALNLIINCLFYLAAEPDDVHLDWELDIPPGVRLKLAEATKPGAIKTLENTLKNAGYSKVRFLGQKFARSALGIAIERSALAGKTLSTHFRRGHFRRQPYGPESSLRKTIFVAPTMVNADKGEPLGRIYSVD